MQVTRKSMISGIVRTIDLPITEDQIRRYEQGVYLQDAFANLSAGQREFIHTGITDDEWDNLFSNREFHGEDFSDKEEE